MSRIYWSIPCSIPVCYSGEPFEALQDPYDQARRKRRRAGNGYGDNDDDGGDYDGDCGDCDGDDDDDDDDDGDDYDGDDSREYFLALVCLTF